LLHVENNHNDDDDDVYCEYVWCGMVWYGRRRDVTVSKTRNVNIWNRIVHSFTAASNTTLMVAAINTTIDDDDDWS